MWVRGWEWRSAEQSAPSASLWVKQRALQEEETGWQWGLPRVAELGEPWSAAMLAAGWAVSSARPWVGPKENVSSETMKKAQLWASPSVNK